MDARRSMFRPRGTPTPASTRPRQWPVTALLLAAAALVGCGGGEGAQAGETTCVGQSFPVGETEMTLIGVGRSVSDAYVSSNLLFDSQDGERVTISSYSGAKVALPSTATDGWTPWHGHRIDVVDAEAQPGPGQITPCIVVEVSELPPDWEPPSDETDAGH